MRGQGSRLHLVGGGSDEIFTAHPSSLHDLARTRPLAAVTRLRATRAPRPLWSQLAQLADRTGFAAWLNGLAADLTTQQPPLAKAEAEIFAMSWGTPSRLPAWATERATHATRELAARLAAAATPPLWPRRGQHVAVHTARASGAGLRQIDQATTAAGLPFAAPFLDDAVIAAALSVRVTDRSLPGRAKPVLAEAMRPIVPGSLLDRPKTGEYSAELYAGLRRHQGELLELTDDSRLARMGLIDAAALRAFLLRPHPRPYALVPLFSTLACEIWLRAQPTGGPSAASGDPA
jgi:asparagine synthase (glutamine-hydrolysing)